MAVPVPRGRSLRGKQTSMGVHAPAVQHSVLYLRLSSFVVAFDSDSTRTSLRILTQ